MQLLTTEPGNPEEILQQRRDIYNKLEYCFKENTLFNYIHDPANHRYFTFQGNITFLHVPGEVRRDSFQGGRIKYSEYLVMFTCGGNNFVIDIEVCRGDEYDEEIHGQMILTIDLIHDFDSIS